MVSPDVASTVSFSPFSPLTIIIPGGRGGGEGGEGVEIVSMVHTNITECQHSTILSLRWDSNPRHSAL